MFHFVYKTINLINRKEYIGVHSTRKVDDGYIGSGKLIRQAIEKYGKENFEYVVLAEFDTRQEALERERELVTPEYVEQPHVYNLRVGGEGGSATGAGHPWAQRENAEDVRQKISDAQKGRPVPEWKRKQIAESLMGKYTGEKSGRFGKKASDETRRKLSEVGRGRKHTEEARRKISEGNKGKKMTEDQRARLSEARKGMRFSEEHRRHIAESKKGQGWSEGQRERVTAEGTYRGINNSAADRTEYTFWHPEHGTFVGTRCALSERYALRIDGIGKLFYPSACRNSYRGWRVLSK